MYPKDSKGTWLMDSWLVAAVPNEEGEVEDTQIDLNEYIGINSDGVSPSLVPALHLQHYLLGPYPLNSHPHTPLGHTQ